MTITTDHISAVSTGNKSKIKSWGVGAVTLSFYRANLLLLSPSKDTLNCQCFLLRFLLAFSRIRQGKQRFKVHMKQNLFLHSCKIYLLKCTIPKFEMAMTKIADFTSAESWAILPRKMVRGLDRVCCEFPWL